MREDYDAVAGAAVAITRHYLAGVRADGRAQLGAARRSSAQRRTGQKFT